MKMKIVVTLAIACLMLSQVNAQQDHPAEEIMPGTFTGQYVFIQPSGTTNATLGSSNYGIRSYGSLAGGYFSTQEAIAGRRNYGWIGYTIGGYGVAAIGNFTGGYFYDDSGTSQVYIAREDYGVYQSLGIRNYFTGNVGIGTLNPSTKLDVNGGVLINSISGGATGQTKILSSPTVAGQGGLILTQVAGYTPGTTGFKFYNTNTGGPNSYLHISAIDQGNPDSIVSNLMTLTYGGMVGIGTSGPKGKLHVTGDIVAGNDANGNKFIIHTRVPTGDFLQITSDDASGNWEWSKGITFVRSTGNVGIGTTGPGYKLDVAGSANAQQLCIAGICQSSWPSSGTNYWTQSGSNLYPNDVNWNVGIGTTTPTQKLDVNGAGRFTGILYLNSPLVFGGDDWRENAIDFGSGAGTNAAGFVGPNDPTYNAIVFHLSQRGTTDKPDVVHLWVNETGQNNEDVFLIERSGPLPTSWKSIFSVRGNADALFGGDTSGAKIGMNGDLSGEPRSIKLRSNMPGDEWNAGTIAYRPSWDINTLAIVGAGTGSDRRVRIYDKLCFGPNDADCRSSWPPSGGSYWTQSGSNLYANDVNWNVGIGTLNPGKKLDVVSASSNVDVARFTCAGGFCQNIITDGTRTADWGVRNDGVYMGANSNHNLVLRTNANDRLAIDTSGNVGIGTANPAYLLHIEGGAPRALVSGTTAGSNVGYKLRAKSSGGTTRDAGYYFTSGDTDATTYLSLSADDANHQLVVTRSGNVGIGTTTPTARLDVNGGAKIQNKINSNLINGFNNILEFTEASHAAIAYKVDTVDEMMFGFHSNGNFYWADSDTYVMTLDSANGNLGVTGTLNVGGDITGNQNLIVNGAIYDGDDSVVDIGESLYVTGTINEAGSDFNLGTNDGRSVGSLTNQRALVHDSSDILAINYGGDFEGGTRVDSNLNVVGGYYKGGVRGIPSEDLRPTWSSTTNSNQVSISNTWTEIMSQSITTTASNSVLLIYFTGTAERQGTGDVNVDYKISVNGIDLAPLASIKPEYIDDNLIIYSFPISNSAATTVAAGTHTVRVLARASAAGGYWFTYGSQNRLNTIAFAY